MDQLTTWLFRLNNSRIKETALRGRVERHNAGVSINPEYPLPRRNVISYEPFLFQSRACNQRIQVHMGFWEQSQYSRPHSNQISKPAFQLWSLSGSYSLYGRCNIRSALNGTRIAYLVSEKATLCRPTGCPTSTWIESAEVNLMTRLCALLDSKSSSESHAAPSCDKRYSS